MNRRKKIGLSFVLLALLEGCSTPMVSEISSWDIDPDVALLTASAANIQKHWNDMAAIESAKYKRDGGVGISSYDVRYIPRMERVVSLGDSWHGPIEPLVREIAGLTGYTIRVLGVKPASEVIVNVSTNYRRVIDILADAGYQAGSRAAVRLMAKDEVIEVEYAHF